MLSLRSRPSLSLVGDDVIRVARRPISCSVDDESSLFWASFCFCSSSSSSSFSFCEASIDFLCMPK